MKFSSINQVKENVVKCTKCDLSKDRTNSVPGKGSFHSKVIFIGEAPGRSEDKHGEPFVGSAGKKLTAALESAGISRDEVYITNIVKCRPPKNRIPKEEEKIACSNYLEAEIKIIKPKIICIMGNTAYKTILGGQNITKNRGKLVKKEGQDYFLTIHPAATIYNRDLYAVLEKDIKDLVKMISKTS